MINRKMRLGYHVPRGSDTLFESIVREYEWSRGQEIYKHVDICFQVFIAGPRSFKLHKLPAEDVIGLGKYLHEHNILLVVHGTYLDRPFGRDKHGSNKSIAAQLQMIHEINKHAGVQLMIGPVIHVTNDLRNLGSDEKNKQILHDIIGRVIFENSVYNPEADNGAKHGPKINTKVNTNADTNILQTVFDDLHNILHAHSKIIFDTAHIFETGVDIHDPKVMHKFLHKVSDLLDNHMIGFHLNDSDTELGSIIDRHAPIGHGHIFGGPGGIKSLQVIFAFIKHHKLYAILENPIEDIPRTLKYIEKHCL